MNVKTATTVHYKKQCTRSKGTRKIQMSKKFIKQYEESLKRITSKKGVLLRFKPFHSVGGCFRSYKAGLRLQAIPASG
jgi:hypothetical protein